MARIGLIGGSGLEKLTLFRNPEEISRKTPYGIPSSTFLKGEIGNSTVFILCAMAEIIPSLQRMSTTVQTYMH